MTFTLNHSKLSQAGIRLNRSGAKEGADRVVSYLADKQVTKVQAAYVLATAYHETATWMQPIREGAIRYGPSYSDANARRAVATLHGKGIIRTNYALPTGPHRQSYYGRGLVQITWYDNYLKFEKLLGKPLTANPDLALDWQVSLDIMYEGMAKGLFRPGKGKLSDIRAPQGYSLARELINGDRNRKSASGTIGADIAKQANQFLSALEDAPSGIIGRLFQKG